jgi:hypothetical protein
MLRQWEKQFPGRVEVMFAALQNVAPSHLADTALFDFAGLGARNDGIAPAWLPGGSDDAEDNEEADAMDGRLLPRLTRRYRRYGGLTLFERGCYCSTFYNHDAGFPQHRRAGQPLGDENEQETG